MSTKLSNTSALFCKSKNHSSVSTKEAIKESFEDNARLVSYNETIIYDISNVHFKRKFAAFCRNYICTFLNENVSDDCSGIFLNKRKMEILPENNRDILKENRFR